MAAGGVDFPYFGSMRRLRFTFDDFLDLEARNGGRSPLDFVGNLMKLSPVDVRLALWIGLRHEDKRGVTLDWVGKSIQKHLEGGGTMVQLLTALDEAFTASGYFGAGRDAEETADGGNPPPTVRPLSSVSRTSGGDSE